jgi:hypothetical protein
MSTMYKGQTKVAFTKTEQLRAVPPAALRLLIDNLFANTLDAYDLPVASVAADEIPQNVLNHLNEFASLVAQRPTKLVAIRRCSSCYVENQPGNLAMTEDGLEQCWKC